jgi:hypothetical protein
MSLKDKFYKKLGERDFTSSKPIRFVYCEVNEDYLVVPKSIHDTVQVLPRRGMVFDSITEGSEVILPQLVGEYIEANLEGIFEEVERLSKYEEKRLFRSYLYLYYNHGTDRYGLLFAPVFYSQPTELELKAIDEITKFYQEEKNNG